MEKLNVIPTDGHGEFAHGVFDSEKQVFVALVSDASLARLFAAAPEMLAALEMALEAFGADYGGPTIDAMRAAIAKAKGES